MGSGVSKKSREDPVVVQKEYTQTRYKFVFVGSSAVGKSNMLSRYINNEFNETHVPTIFENCSSSAHVEGKTLTFDLWDTSGDTACERLRLLTYPNTDIVYICYSVVNIDSFLDVKRLWIPELEKTLKKDVRIILVGTQTDLRYDEEIIDNLEKSELEPLTYGDGYTLANDIGAIGYVECSSLRKENLERVFEEGYKFCSHKIENYCNPNYDIKAYTMAPLYSRAKSARK